MFLTIENGKLVTKSDDGVTTVIDTFDKLKEALSTDGLMASSSVDFPEEYTTDPKTLVLCTWLANRTDVR
jgi:hypothetical protein